MAESLPEEWFVKDARVNAAMAWMLVALLAATAAWGVLNLRIEVALVAGVAAAVAVVPALVHRSATTTIPWPLLLVAGLPVWVQTARPSFLDEVLTGLGIAALAMLVVVSLQLVTAVRMTPSFAIWFTFMATLGVAGVWTLGSAASARLFGTAFVETNTQLMTVFTAVVLAGILAGGLFRWYFRRRLARDGRRADVSA